MSKLSKFILYAIYFFMVIGLGAVIVMSFAPKQSPKQAASSHQTVAVNTKTTPKATQPSQTTPASTNASQRTTSSANQKGSLQNTGPGSVTYLFLVSSIIGFLAYRRFITSRQNDSSARES